MPNSNERNFIKLCHAKKLLVLSISLFLIGCASTPTTSRAPDSSQTETSSQGTPSAVTGEVKPGSTIVVMPLDIELSLVTTSGLLEPKAEWTERADKHMNAELTNLLEGTLVDGRDKNGRSRDI